MSNLICFYISFLRFWLVSPLFPLFIPFLLYFPLPFLFSNFISFLFLLLSFLLCFISSFHSSLSYVLILWPSSFPSLLPFVRLCRCLTSVETPALKLDWNVASWAPQRYSGHEECVGPSRAAAGVGVGPMGRSLTSTWICLQASKVGRPEWVRGQINEQRRQEKS